MGAKHITVFVLPNSKAINRLGVSASKKVGGAVVRNKARRRLKEAWRLLEADIQKGHDIVLLPRASIAEADFAEIKSGLRQALRKHGILRQTEGST